MAGILDQLKKLYPELSDYSDADIVGAAAPMFGGSVDEAAKQLGVQRNQPGFMTGLKSGLAAYPYGAGRALEDAGATTVGRGLQRYGQDVQFRNPTTVHDFSSFAESPWQGVKELTGQALGSTLPALVPYVGPVARGLGTAGGIAAGTGVMAVPSYGGIRQTQDETGEANIPAAIAGSLASGAVEQFGGVQRLLRPRGSPLYKDFLKSPVRTALSVGGRTALEEGAEELAQSPIEQYAGGQDPTDPKHLAETAFAGFGGVIGGLPFGGMAGARRGLQHRAAQGFVDRNLNNPGAPTDTQLETFSIQRHFLEQQHGPEVAQAWYTNEVNNLIRTGIAQGMASGEPVSLLQPGSIEMLQKPGATDSGLYELSSPEDAPPLWAIGEQGQAYVPNQTLQELGQPVYQAFPHESAGAMDLGVPVEDQMSRAASIVANAGAEPTGQLAHDLPWAHETLKKHLTQTQYNSFVENVRQGTFRRDEAKRKAKPAYDPAKKHGPALQKPAASAPATEPFVKLFKESGGVHSNVVMKALAEVQTPEQALEVVRARLERPASTKVLHALEEMHKKLSGKTYTEYLREQEKAEALKKAPAPPAQEAAPAVVAPAGTQAAAAPASAEAPAGKSVSLVVADPKASQKELREARRVLIDDRKDLREAGRLTPEKEKQINNDIEQLEKRIVVKGKKNGNSGQGVPARTEETKQPAAERVRQVQAESPAQDQGARSEGDEVSNAEVETEEEALQMVLGDLALKDPNKAVILSRHLGGESDADIAKSTGMSKQRVQQMRQEAAAMVEGIIRRKGLDRKAFNKREGTSSSSLTEKQADVAALAPSQQEDEGAPNTGYSVVPEDKVNSSNIENETEEGAANKIAAQTEKALSEGDLEGEASAVWDTVAHASSGEGEKMAPWSKLTTTKKGQETQKAWVEFYKKSKSSPKPDAAQMVRIRKILKDAYYSKQSDDTFLAKVGNIREVSPFENESLTKVLTTVFNQGLWPVLGDRLAGVYLSDAKDPSWDATVTRHGMVGNQYILVVSQRLWLGHRRYTSELIERAFRHEVEHILDDAAEPISQYSMDVRLGAGGRIQQEIITQLGTPAGHVLFAYPMKDNLSDDTTRRELFAQIMSAYHIPKMRSFLEDHMPQTFRFAQEYYEQELQDASNYQKRGASDGQVRSVDSSGVRESVPGEEGAGAETSGSAEEVGKFAGVRQQLRSLEEELYAAVDAEKDATKARTINDAANEVSSEILTLNKLIASYDRNYEGYLAGKSEGWLKDPAAAERSLERSAALIERKVASLEKHRGLLTPAEEAPDEKVTARTPYTLKRAEDGTWSNSELSFRDGKVFKQEGHFTVMEYAVHDAQGNLIGVVDVGEKDGQPGALYNVESKLPQGSGVGEIVTRALAATADELYIDNTLPRVVPFWEKMGAKWITPEKNYGSATLTFENYQLARPDPGRAAENARKRQEEIAELKAAAENRRKPRALESRGIDEASLKGLTDDQLVDAVEILGGRRQQIKDTAERLAVQREWLAAKREQDVRRAHKIAEERGLPRAAPRVLHSRGLEDTSLPENRFSTDDGTRYEVVDRSTGKAVAGPFKNRYTARRAVDRLDNEYGGYKHHVRPVSGSMGPPKPPRILESRGLEDVPPSKEQGRAITTISDMWAKFKPTLLTLHQLVDQFGDKLASLKSYVASMDKMEQRQQTLVQKAHSTLLKWQGLHGQTRNALNELMLRATTRGIHPDEPFGAGLNAHVTDQDEYDSLKRRFDGLSPESRKIYKEVRKLLEDNWQARKEAFSRAVTSAYKKLIDEAPDAAQVAKLTAERDKYISEHAKQIHSIKGPYFPLLRFGDYLMIAESPRLAALREQLEDATGPERTQLQKEVDRLKKDANHYVVQAHESKYKADQAAAKYRGNLRTRVQLAEEHFRQLQPVSAGAVDRIGERISAAFDKGTANKMKGIITQLYISTLPEHAALQRQLRRQGIEGAAEDMLRAVAQAVEKDSFHLSRMEFADEVTSNLFKLKQESKKAGVEYQHVYNDIAARVALDFDWKPTPVQSALTRMSGIWHLGMSPAYLLTNATQPWMITAPVLAGKFGLGRSFDALRSAWGDAASIIMQSKKDGAFADINFDGVRDPGERAALKMIMDRGQIDITQNVDMGLVADGVDPKFLKAQKAFNWANHHIEASNRIVTGLAAYRLARSQGMSETAAQDYAFKTVVDTQLNYTNANAAYWMKPGAVPLGKLIFQFRKYQQGMVYLLARNAQLAFQGDHDAQRALAYLMGMQLVMAGAVGIPVAMPVLSAMSAFIGGDDEKGDAETRIRNYLADTMGPDAARAVWKGLPTMLGLDVSQRVGMGQILSPLPFLRLTGKTGQEDVGQLVANVLGAPVGMIGKMWDSTNFFGKGDWVRGTEQLLPKMLADPLKAARYADRGVSTRSGTVALKPERFDAWDIAFRAAGFSPTAESEHYAAVSSKEKIVRETDERRKALLANYANTSMRGEDTASVMEAIDSFNEDHPLKGLRIDRSTLLRAVQTRKRGEKDLDEAGVRFPKNQRSLRGVDRYAYGA